MIAVVIVEQPGIACYQLVGTRHNSGENMLSAQTGFHV